MELKPEISLSKKALKTLRAFPEFFVPVLNALYDLHLRHGFRKPELSIYRDESTATFTCPSHTISVICLWPDTIYLVDSRTCSKDRYKTFIKAQEREFPAKITEFLRAQWPLLAG